MAVRILLASVVLVGVAGQTDNVTLLTETIATTVATPTLRSSIPRTRSMVSYCECDLSESSCDFNCCCDTDCGETERQYFTTCPSGAEAPQRDSYQCSSWNSFFCVYRDNVRKISIYEDSPGAEVLALTSDSCPFKWTPDIEESNEWLNQPIYKYGSPIFATQGDTTATFSMPGGWNSPSCNSRKQILFLQDAESKCRVHISDLPSMCGRYHLWSAPSILGNTSILKYPYLAKKNSLDNVENLIPLRVRQCLNDTYCQESDSLSGPVWDDQQQTCATVVKSIVYRFLFNSTVGIVKIYADVQFQNLTRLSDSATLSFGASFAGRPVFQRSGNPGYAMGKPVLAGILNSNGTVETVTLLTVLKTSVLHKKPVLFGWDSYDVVELREPTENATENRCNFWRQTIISSFASQTLENVTSLVIGSFADGLVNKTEDWLPVTYEDDLEDCDSGHFFLQILVTYAKVGLARNPQNKLRGFHVNLTTSSDTKLGKPTLISAVKFVDATVDPAVVLPRPPRIRVSLPKDFFYPFLMSSSSRLVPCVSLSLVLAIFKLVFY